MKVFLVIAVIGLAASLALAVAPDCSTTANGVSLPDIEDCEWFYVCNDGVAVEKKCRNGLHFNPIKLYCQSPAQAGCTPGSTPPGTPPSPTPPSPTPPGGTPPSTPPGAPSGSCEGQKLGKNIPFKGDCTRYITCIGGGVVRDCPDKLHFNAKKEVCDWPERAGCTQ